MSDHVELEQSERTLEDGAIMVADAIKAFHARLGGSTIPDHLVEKMTMEFAQALFATFGKPVLSGKPAEPNIGI
jgi:hypothetical protein